MLPLGVKFHRKSTVRWYWLLPAALVFASLLALGVDLPVAGWFLSGGCPDLVRKLLTLSEAFAHGIGVGVILLVIFTLDVPRRPLLPRLAAASLGAGLCANILKLLVSRTRPKHFDFEGTTVADTFSDWLPLLGGGSSGQGFPSAHTATGAGLAFALVWLYPRGRWLFPALAVLAAGQRLASGAHFASDVLCGAAAGCFFAALCMHGRALSRGFNRLENHLSNRWLPAPVAADPIESDDGATRHAA